MTRQFHGRVRFIPRPRRRSRRPYTLSFTCFRLVPDPDTLYTPIELVDPTNAMRLLVLPLQ